MILVRFLDLKFLHDVPQDGFKSTALAAAPNLADSPLRRFRLGERKLQRLVRDVAGPPVSGQLVRRLELLDGGRGVGAILAIHVEGRVATKEVERRLQPFHPDRIEHGRGGRGR